MVKFFAGARVQKADQQQPRSFVNRRSSVLEFAADQGYSARVVRLGVPDRWIEHGTQDELYTECGFNVEDIAAAARKLMSVGQRRATAG